MPTLASAPLRQALPATLAPGLSAIRRYWRPFVFLQSATLFLVMAYFRNARVAAICDGLSTFKTHSGLLFSAISAAGAGALLPEVAKAAVMGDRALSRQRARNVVFAVAAFGLSGIINDLQYRGMAVVFGDDHRIATVLRKMLADQFVTTPLYGTPYWLVVYAIREDRYRPWRTVPRLTPAWYLRTVTPLLITGWAYWIPMSTLLYSMPGPLQFCMYLVMVAGWSLLMVAVASDQAGHGRQPSRF